LRNLEAKLTRYYLREEAPPISYRSTHRSATGCCSCTATPFGYWLLARYFAFEMAFAER
jgi:hypothetical protein